jgi:spermidine/putrescine transport system substrate-binding protein
MADMMRLPRRDILLGAGVLAGCARDRRPRLNVFNWSAYIADDTVPKFEREFSCHVRYGVYESNEEMLARVMGGNSGWDVTFPTDYIIKPMLANGLLAEIRHHRLSNLKNLETSFQRPRWDPELRWSVPYMVTAAGIAYSRKLDPPPRAWADLWSTRLKGRITMLDDPFDVMAACLKKIGDSVNAEDAVQLRAAQRQAIEQKPLLRAYLNAEARDQLVSGDILAAQMWNTTAQQAMDSANDLGFVYPAEGYAVYPDTMVILRESKHQELALQFVDFMLRPDIAAANALAARTTTTNAAARALLPQDFRSNPTLYPAPDVVARGEWAETLDPAAQRLRDRLWTEIKSA